MNSPHFDNYGQSVDHFTYEHEIKIRNDHITELKHKVETLHQEQEQASESFQLALLSSSQWQQRAELAERQRDEWRALAEELQARLASACPDCGLPPGSRCAQCKKGVMCARERK